MITISKGLNLPISGEPDQSSVEVKSPLRVALLGEDYHGMRPTMAVKIGDEVKKGQLLFIDKKVPGVKFTAPISGKISEINRGERRVFKSLVIDASGNGEITFPTCVEEELKELADEKIRECLIDSGLWTSFRTRPFSRSPMIDSKPHSIFVTATDSNPLAVDPNVVISENQNVFRLGLIAISKLTSGHIFLCKGPGTNVPTRELDFVVTEVFDGPHPSGCAGTHIHQLDPVSENKTVWTIGYQDLISIGLLFHTGKLNLERMISLAGPGVKNPKLIKTIVGADLTALTAGEAKDDTNRIISGSVFYGHHAKSPVNYLGRFHNQVTVIAEGTDREFLGWFSPGLNKFSVKNVLLSKIFPNRDIAFTSALNGGKRSMVPIGMYEKVMPLDILPTFLLRSLLSKDTEMAQKLGCLELDEEDLALCTMVCPSKLDYGKVLRDNLTQIEKDG